MFAEWRDGRTDRQIDGWMDAGTKILDPLIRAVSNISSIFQFPFYGGKEFCQKTGEKKSGK